MTAAEGRALGGRALRIRVGVGSVCSPLEVGADRAPAAADDLARTLEAAGCECVPLGPVDTPEKARDAGRRLAEQHVHAAAFVSVSWFEDYLVLDLLEEAGLPVVLWALPGMETGALCGVQQLTSYLKQLGKPYHAVFGPLDDAAACGGALTMLRAAAMHHRLRRARVGFAGDRAGGMTEIAPHEFALKKTIGPRIVPLDVPQLLERARNSPKAEAAAQWEAVTACAGGCSVSAEDGVDAMQVCSAITGLVEEHGLDALTVGCYPHLMGRVCLVASVLADRGVPLGCEGDANGAVGMLMMMLLSGQPTHNTDWLEPLPDGSVVFSHCGSGSFSLAEDPKAVTLNPVRLMDQGVCSLFTARPGPVTLLNLLPVGDGYRAAVLEGEAVSTQMVFPGNPLRVKFRRPTPQVVQWIFDEGVGHHWMAGYGHHAAALRQWAKLAGPGLRLIEG